MTYYKPSDAIIQEFLKPVKTITRAMEIYEIDGVTPWRPDLWSRAFTGSVSVKYGNDERRSVDVTISNGDGALVHDPGQFWYDKVLKFYRGVKYWDGGIQTEYRVPLGVFMMESIEESRFPQSLAISGRDFTKKLENEFGFGYTAPKGSLANDVIITIAGMFNVTRMTLYPSTFTLQDDLVWDASDTGWTAITALAALINCEPFFDADGLFRTQPIQDPTLTPATHSFYDYGANANMIDWTKSSSDTDIINRVIVSGDQSSGTDDSGNAEPTVYIYAEVVNDDPNSPTSTKRIGTRTWSYSSSAFSTNEQAKEYALAMLKIKGLEDFTIATDSPVLPWLDAGDIVEAFTKTASQGNEPNRFLLTDFSIPFEPGKMSSNAKRIINIGAPNTSVVTAGDF